MIFSSESINSPDLEIKKREAESDIAGFKEERLKDSLFREQVRFRELTNASYTAYDPWGRPGAGAPISRMEHKKKKFTEYDGFKNDVGMTGLLDNIGMPRRQSVGNLSELSLEETQAKINSYRQELRMVRADRAKNSSFEYYDPWGKGQGNPRRGYDGCVERHAGIKEKGIVPPLNNEDVRISMEGLRDKNIGVGLETRSQYGGGGEPAKTRSGNVKTRFPTTMKHDIHGNVALEEQGYDPFKSMSIETETSYFPFGKPGGGAPLKSDEGRIAPQRRGVNFHRELDTSADVSKRKEAAESYNVELKKEMNEQRRARKLEREDLHAPFGELADVVRQGKVGFPNRDPSTGQLVSQHKSTSDVTKHKMGKTTTGRHMYAGVLTENNSNGNPREYYDQLSVLADERHKQRQVDRDLELKQENQHTESWSDIWGRPGGGAPPKEVGFKKTKLDKSLHYPDPTNVPLPAPKVPKNLSSHENNFQLSEDRSMFKPQSGFGVLAPYATY